MAEQPKEFYCKYQGFEFKSGIDDGAGRVIDYQVMTDTLQGIKFCTDGTHFQLNYKTNGIPVHLPSLRIHQNLTY